MGMTGNEIRSTFLSYFEERGHVVVPSSSLVPDDPTLLFVNAGMVQFKDAFLGLQKREYSRATSAQRCLRVSGKHNDIEQVGPSARHHTYFEMLGNFSFGDYFKREAISYAWELLTDVYGLARDRFHITVHQDDHESYALWQEIARTPRARIYRMGEKTNFWMMGETGPCGPNTELIWDGGPERCVCQRPDCSPHLDNDCPRWIEIWNLVFMQYDENEKGERRPLPKPGVDTGMGFERLVSAIQNARTNYDTDLFQPVFARVRELLGHSEQEMRTQLVPYRVIADHGRAMTFLLADGVLPGNEKHGYVLRMIMRRAIRFGKKLGFEEPFLAEIARVVIAQMGAHYRELKEHEAFLLQAIAQEEERFERTLDAGLERLAQIVEGLNRRGQETISGADAFKLHDTYGFPIELTIDIAREQGFAVDRAGFEREMETQRERSRTAVKSGVRVGARDTEGLPPTGFRGYDDLELNSELLAVWGEEERSGLVARETPFYAEGGGQVADTGSIENLSRPGRADVEQVERAANGVFVHRVLVREGRFEPGDRCRLRVDAERRRATMRNHTATHILHAALRKILSYSGGIQAGSFVSPTELRFDYRHGKALTGDQLQQVEQMCNEVILSDLPVIVDYATLSRAKARGAMALFTEDYADVNRVRVVQVGDAQPFSVELCGGTHVQHTGEIGSCKIIAEEGISAGVRRVRVVTGHRLLDFVREREQTLQQLARLMRSSEKELITKCEAMLHEMDALRGSLTLYKQKLLAWEEERLARQRAVVGDQVLICAQVDWSVEEMKDLADRLQTQLARSVIILGTRADGKVAVVCKVSPELSSRFSARDIVQSMTRLVQGSGGGTALFAQGGGGDASRLDEALRHGESLFRQLAEAQ